MKTWIALGLAGLIAGGAIAQTPANPQNWEPYSAGLQSRAAAGDAAAQFSMGEAFRTGNGIGPDREQAIAWYRRAASRDVRAADALGVLLFTKGERKEAIPLLQGAALRRDPYALYILGTARFNGDYVPKDLGRAYADMRIAAQTLQQAQRSLGLMEPYVTPIDRMRADQLATLPGGPEAGAPAAPSYAAVAPRPTPAPIVASKPAPPRIIAASSPPRPPLSIDVPTDTSLSSIAAPTTLTASKAVPLTTRPVVAATTPLPTGNWRVQLGAYSSEDVANAQWKAFAAKLPELAKLKKVTAPAGALVRLQATGIATRDEATALCTAATAIKAPCLVLAQ